MKQNGNKDGPVVRDLSEKKASLDMDTHTHTTQSQMLSPKQSLIFHLRLSSNQSIRNAIQYKVPNYWCKVAPDLISS